MAANNLEVIFNLTIKNADEYEKAINKVYEKTRELEKATNELQSLRLQGAIISNDEEQ